jgi:hypothetical protein
MTRHFKFATLALLVASAAVIAAGPAAHARTGFDGAWSVVIISEQGSCDGTYRYPLQITNGRVLPGDEGPYTVDGRVDPRGSVSVNVAQGDQRAHGTGQLRGANGSGVWKSPGGCAGRWEAERRS